MRMKAMPNGVSVKGGPDMFSVIDQNKTTLRDSCGGSVYRRVYLCDSEADLSDLPVSDAPGSVAYTADAGQSYVLDHVGNWRACSGGGVPWHV